MEIKLTEIAQFILEDRYLLRDDKNNIIETPEQMFRRVAKTVAKADKKYNGNNVKETEDTFFNMMTRLDFMPNSPTLFNSGKDMTLSACFVIPVDDDLESIFNSIKHCALIHKAGGGTGISFSRLRPKNDRVKSTNGVSSGPVSFMKIFNAATNEIKQGSFRRGANLGSLRVDHEDILDFIKCKNNEGELENFNISVSITDTFMEALENNREYKLFNPRTMLSEKTLKAEKIWNEIINGIYKTGEPGVIFITQVNNTNPTPNLGKIETSNPCAEQMLLPYSSCNLGSINLLNFITEKTIRWKELKECIYNTIHFLDNTIDVNNFPLKEIEEMAHKQRNIGLGIMGFHDALIKQDIKYNSQKAVSFAEKIMRFINETAFETSCELAKERGPFPAIKGSVYDKPFFDKPRNASRTTIAPTGCCNRGTKIKTNKGLLNIEDFFIEPPIKQGWYDLKEDINIRVGNKEIKPNKGYYKGKDRGYKFQFSNGTPLILSKEHKLMVFDNGWYWKKAEQIKEGDLILSDNNKKKTHYSLFTEKEKLIKIRNKIWEKFGSKSNLYSAINQACQKGRITKKLYNRVKKHTDIEIKEYELFDNPIHLEVTKKEKVWGEFFDVSVPELNSYIFANSVYSHNSISQICGVSSGMEPNFDYNYTRLICNKEKNIRHWALDDNTIDRKVLLKSTDIHWKWHVKMQAAFQKYVDNSISKCIAKGTLIQTNKGIFKIEDLGKKHKKEDTFTPPIEDDIFVYDENGDLKKITSHYYGGHKKTIKIRFNNGFILEGSQNHKIMTTTGWKKLKNITIDDFIICKRKEYPDIKGNLKIKIPSTKNLYQNTKLIDVPKYMNEDLALFLGMMVSDGSLTKTTGTINFTCANDYLENLFTKLSKKLFNLTPTIRYDRRTKSTRTLQLYSVYLKKYIKALIGNGCRYKHTPEQVLKGSKKEQLAFLSGVTLDGYIKTNYGDRLELCIYEGYSKRLRDEISSICCLLGQDYYKYSRAINKKENTYGIIVDRNFIKPLDKHKQKKLKEKVRFVLIPRLLYKINKSNLNSQTKNYRQIKYLQKKNNKFLKNNTLDSLGVNYDKNICIIKPTHINFNKNDIYDIEVEDTHSYMIDNIISHNTIIMPNNCSKKDIGDALLLAYKLGCKSTTIYRNDSRKKQVLTNREKCPNCGEGLIPKEGCLECPKCGYSKCSIK